MVNVLYYIHYYVKKGEGTNTGISLYWYSYSGKIHKKLMVVITSLVRILLTEDGVGEGLAQHALLHFPLPPSPPLSTLAVLIADQSYLKWYRPSPWLSSSISEL